MIIELLSWFCIVSGGLLGITGGIGMHRFPDVFSRLHAAGTTDTLCAALFLLGLALQSGLTLASVKLLVVFVFLLFTSPAASHALANAAWLGGLKPKLDSEHSHMESH